MKNQINELQNFIDKQKGSLKIKVRKQAISDDSVLQISKAVSVSDEDWEHLALMKKIKFGSNMNRRHCC